MENARLDDNVPATTALLSNRFIPPFRYEDNYVDNGNGNESQNGITGLIETYESSPNVVADDISTIDNVLTEEFHPAPKRPVFPEDPKEPVRKKFKQ